MALECDYTWEARCQEEFRTLVQCDPELREHVNVPAPIHELCTRQVMTSEWVTGVPIDQVGGWGGSSDEQQRGRVGGDRR